MFAKFNIPPSFHNNLFELGTEETCYWSFGRQRLSHSCRIQDLRWSSVLDFWHIFVFYDAPHIVMSDVENSWVKADQCDTMKPLWRYRCSMYGLAKQCKTKTWNVLTGASYALKSVSTFPRRCLLCKCASCPFRWLQCTSITSEMYVFSLCTDHKLDGGFVIQVFNFKSAIQFNEL